MLDLRLKTDLLIQRLKKGESLKLTYRGNDLAYLTPGDDFAENSIDDPFYSIAEIASPMGSLSNQDIDKILYG